MLQTNVVFIRCFLLCLMVYCVLNWGEDNVTDGNGNVAVDGGPLGPSPFIVLLNIKVFH